MGLHITVIGAGRLKESYWRDAVDEYAKRLQRYCTFSIVEVQDEKTPDHPSDAQRNQILDIEGQRILHHVKDRDYVIALAIKGRKYTSEGFAREISRLEGMGHSSIVLIIGGSLGLSEEVLGRSNAQISFSDMTFPHQLMRVILLEQIYRAFRIIRNEPYHK